MKVLNNLRWMLLASLIATVAVGAADKDKKKKDQDEKPFDPKSLLLPSERQLAEEAASQNVALKMEQELKNRAIPVPGSLKLDMEWYSPHIDAERYGQITRGWAVNDLVLLETDTFNLLAVRRSDGVLRWVCQLNDEVRYQPSVTRNNVVVNVKNFLVAIHKEGGYIRWRLLPKFVMSTAPLVIDPPVYPRQYDNTWRDLEHVYVGAWDGRFHNMVVRVRNRDFVKGITSADALIAPEFDLYYQWHKTHESRGIINAPIALRDNLMYYAADDQRAYCVSRDGDERIPYFMLGAPTTGITVTGTTAANVTNSVLTSMYVGAKDASLYCLDRLTLRKKWHFPIGYEPYGTILADEAVTPFVYVAAKDGAVHGVKVTPAKQSKGQPEIPESYEEAWKVPAQGIIGAGPEAVYLGTGKYGEWPSYSGIKAVDKSSGNVLWEVAASEDLLKSKDKKKKKKKKDDEKEPVYFTQYLEFHNAWNSGTDARLYALTNDNRVVSFKEKIRDTSVRTYALPKEDVPVMPKKKEVPKEGEAPAPAPAN